MGIAGVREMMDTSTHVIEEGATGFAVDHLQQIWPAGSTLCVMLQGFFDVTGYGAALASCRSEPGVVKVQSII